MNRTIKLLALILLTSFLSCIKDKETTPALLCKLATIDRGNLNKHFYTYDAAGKITTMTREFDGNGSGKVSKFVYTLTYDEAGLLKSAAITLDGVADSKETYNYTNGRVSKTDFEYTNGTKGYNAIKYDNNGQILEFTYQTSGKEEEDSKAYFAYDANGVMVKRGYSDLTGNSKFFEVIIKPVGSAKSPEVLLNNNGLPYDLLTGFSYSRAEGGIGSTTEVYVLNDKGVLTLAPETSKVTAIKTNAKGYLTEMSFEDEKKASSTQKFEMNDCQ
jgi:YD repeat-containing protein